MAIFLSSLVWAFLFLSVMMKLVGLRHDVLGPNRFQLSVIILWSGDLACLEYLQKI